MLIARDPPFPALVGLLLFQLLGDFPQALHGLDFLPHGFHLLVLQIFLRRQLIHFGLPFLRGDRLAGSFQIFQIPGGGFIQSKLRAVTLLK